MLVDMSALGESDCSPACHAKVRFRGQSGRSMTPEIAEMTVR